MDKDIIVLVNVTRQWGGEIFTHGKFDNLQNAIESVKNGLKDIANKILFPKEKQDKVIKSVILSFNKTNINSIEKISSFKQETIKQIDITKSILEWIEKNSK